MNYEIVINAMVNACAEAGKKVAQQNAMWGSLQPLYLYYKKSTENTSGSLVLVSDQEKAPTGFELATGEGLRCDVPYERYFDWVRARSSRLPVLAWA